MLHTEKDGQILKERTPTLQGNYMTYYDGIYQALRHQKPVPIAAEDGMLVIKIIEACLQSNAEKKVLQLL